MLDRRRLSGRIAYLDGSGQPTGRELFSISVHADGSRTLRAQCEMDDDALVRDALLAIGPDNRPREAFVRIVERGTHLGSRYYDSRELGGAGYFGTHALANDAWVALLGGDLADGESRAVEGLTCSHQANGGGVPAMLASHAVLMRLGAESLSVAAGRFDVVHWSVAYGGHTPIDFWTTGPDHVLVLMTWPHLNGRYELAQLDEVQPSH